MKINYQSIGSGGGIRQVSEGTVDFGASDGPMTDEQLAEAKVKVMHIPTVLGAVVPVYNLPGVNKELNFSGDVIADIYLGKITKWNDRRIAKDNPGVNLPDKAILPVYRSDGSGTTFIFTDFLSKVSPAWKSGPGKGAAIKWPIGIGQKGNEGVAGMVRQSPYSFGYVELIYAVQNKMSYGLVKNASGKFVKASTDGVTAAAAACRQDHARRLSCLDHQRSRCGLLPDLQLHLAADPDPLHRSRQGQGPRRLPRLDARSRRERGCRADLRSAAEAGAGHGPQEHRNHQVVCPAARICSFQIRAALFHPGSRASMPDTIVP